MAVGGLQGRLPKALPGSPAGPVVSVSDHQAPRSRADTGGQSGHSVAGFLVGVHGTGGFGAAADRGGAGGAPRSRERGDAGLQAACPPGDRLVPPPRAVRTEGRAETPPRERLRSKGTLSRWRVS